MLASINRLSVLIVVLHHAFVLFGQGTFHGGISFGHGGFHVLRSLAFGRNRFVDGQREAMAVYPLACAGQDFKGTVDGDGHDGQLQVIGQLESTALEVTHMARERACTFGKNDE